MGLWVRVGPVGQDPYSNRLRNFETGSGVVFVGTFEPKVSEGPKTKGVRVVSVPRNELT